MKLVLDDRKMFALSFDIKFDLIEIEKSRTEIEKRSVVTNNTDFFEKFFQKIRSKNFEIWCRFLHQSIEQIETNRSI
jgi:hypothetical protein